MDDSNRVGRRGSTCRSDQNSLLWLASLYGDGCGVFPRTPVLTKCEMNRSRLVGVILYALSRLLRQLKKPRMETHCQGVAQ